MCRIRSDSGVKRRKASFYTGRSNGGGSGETGISAGSDVPIVLELTGALKYLVQKHLQGLELASDESVEPEASR